jgi:hypothetical protein
MSCLGAAAAFCALPLSWDLGLEERPDLVLRLAIFGRRIGA